MARILLAEEWVEPSPLAIQLQYDLSEDYLVVSDPTVRGRKLSAVVVGPQGLFVLHPASDSLSPSAQENGDNPPSGMEQRVSRATKALKAFLRDEFPATSLRVHHLLVVDGTPEAPDRPPTPEVALATVDSAAQEIASVDLPATGALLDDEDRQEVAVALRDRKLTLTQRASQPFVFRSGDVFGSGTEVWTVREAVRHMAANPESGIYHLRNGTLAAWLHSEGAEHLARVARDVVRSYTDRRAALEAFLIETGVVDPPRLSVHPTSVDLGYLTAGEDVTRRITVSKSGRGYLFGRLEPSVPWLSVYPRQFTSESSDTVVAVHADSESLPIGQRPSRASIAIPSNASEEPVEVPVHIRVVGQPSAFNRQVLRPAAGGVVAGLIGAGLGGLLTVGGAPAAGVLGGLGWLPLSPVLVWVMAITFVWAALGALRGAMQPEAWPTSYAMGRWLFRILVWAVSLTLVGAACLWCWGQLRPRGATPVSDVIFRSALVIPMVLAVLPATVGEIRSGPRMRDTSLQAIRWSFLRPFLLPLGAIVVALVAALGAPRLRPAIEEIDIEAAMATIRERTETGFSRVEERLERVIDELYMRYYDR